MGMVTGLYKWLLIFFLFCTIIAIAVWYYKDTQRRIAVLIENAGKLELAVQTQTDTIQSMIEDFELIRQSRDQVDKQFADGMNRVRMLEERFLNHDLSYLARNRPGLIENRINQATKDSNRCFEILSGSPLTLQEIDAVLPSQINNICPDLANPNYVAR